MSKEVLQDIIKDFNPDKFVRFFREKNRSFAPRKEELFQYNDENFQNGIKLGEIQFDQDEKMLICAFEVGYPLSERSGKKAQYEKGKKILKDSQSDAGIFIFYDEQGNSRFSLIYANYLGKHRDWSAFRRFTYFISTEYTNKTFLQQIGEEDFPSLDKLKDAFSVEKVTKAFYTDIANWYFWAVRKTEFPKDAEEENGKNIAVIRMITRLIFIWFMKEKGLIRQDLFNYSHISSLLKDLSPKSTTYYKAILQNLFFATLNTKIEDRKFRFKQSYQGKNKDYMDHSIYRYEDYFKNKEDMLEIFKDIPFLNGGLFDCLDGRITENGKNIEIRIDGFTDKEVGLSIPNKLFFSEEIDVDLNKDYGTKNKNYKVRGLINTLSSYNFTIDENDPNDADIALDPELLGKVFENLLASFNPETATTARKATGSYYTPREIVNYMVDESLNAYLSNKLSDDGKEDNRVRHLFAYTDEPHQFSPEEVDTLINAIDNAKILDPACGSGAFPMGILRKLVYVLGKLDPDNSKWREVQRQKAIKETEETFKIGNKEERIKRLFDIDDAFENNSSDYGRKLYLIENCIYGVDIQPIAVQIAKLRFFISLLVDQNISTKKENLGVRPLPNLETKFVAANTLIGIEKPAQGLLRNPEIDRKEAELNQVRERHFTARTPKTKQKCIEDDKKLRAEISELLKKDGFPSGTTEKLANWNPYDQNASADFFEPEWMFGITEGFDVVIGNPPYIKEYTYREAFDGVRVSQYYQGKMDIWYLFACKGIDNIREKGLLTFIAQNNWVTSHGASKMRNKVIADTKILSLLDFGDYKIFENAGIQTMVMMFQRDKETDNYPFDYRRISGKKISFEDVLDLLNCRTNSANEYLNPKINRNKLMNQPLTFSNSNINAVFEKMLSKADFHLTKTEVANGIHHHHDSVDKERQKILGGGFKIGDGIFVLSDKEKNNISFLKNELELLKPSYTTKELHKWYGDPKNKEWVIYTDSSFKDPKNIKHFPNIKAHLDKFKKVITSDNKPYGLHRARDEYFFKGEKIIAVRKCIGPTFTYTDFDCYVSATFYVIKSERLNLKYLTAILNSRLIAFWLKHKGKMQGNNYQIDKEPLLSIPIHNASDKKQQSFITLVDQILATKKKDPNADTSALEKQIDQMVYALYGLTPEEIAIVEGK